jgi:thioredoxin-like negative regulator of GroEL
LKLNVDENPATQARYNVLSIPTVILFADGEAREAVVGARPRSHYEVAWGEWLSAA